MVEPSVILEKVIIGMLSVPSSLYSAQISLDTGGVQPSYLGPPESIRM